jgi:vancomycin resistance protein YoaR
MIRTITMSPRSTQRGAVLLGLAGGLLVAAGGLSGAYYVLSTRSSAHAATLAPSTSGLAEARSPKPEAQAPASTSAALAAVLARPVEVTTASGKISVPWSQLGAEVDPDELDRASTATDADVAALAAKGSLPIRINTDAAIAELRTLKSKLDRAPLDAWLDLENREVHPDTAGRGLDVFASLSRLETAARQGAPSVQLVDIAVPARTTVAGLGIDDISQVLGHYKTQFSVGDRDRNFNLKLAASKLNGVVLQPGVEFSFNGTVGERSEQMGYKIAHVITAGELVDGLAGGTCQISTTLFGASFFAGLDIVKTTNHSRPSAYTPLGFDATVVWPDTDLKLKNPYEFPVVIHYRVANGEAVVEILGKARPYDKVVFERKVIEETPFTSEERLDEEVPDGITSLDQAGFDGYKLERYRRFYKDGKAVKADKWIVTYKPVTEYVRRGTNKDPDAKAPPVKEIHPLHAPDSDTFSMAQ